MNYVCTHLTCIRMTHTYSLYYTYYIHVVKTFLVCAPFDFDLAIVSWMKLRITQNIASRNFPWMLLVLKNLVQRNITRIYLKTFVFLLKYLKTKLKVCSLENDFFFVYGICDEIWIILEYILYFRVWILDHSFRRRHVYEYLIHQENVFGLSILLHVFASFSVMVMLCQIMIPYSNAHS